MSFEKGKWESEKEYGRRPHPNFSPFLEKRFFVAESFKKDPRYSMKDFNLNLLIVQAGKARLIHPKPIDIDYTLIGENLTDNNELRGEGKCLTWNELFDLIQPPIPNV